MEKFSKTMCSISTFQALSFSFSAPISSDNKFVPPDEPHFTSLSFLFSLTPAPFQFKFNLFSTSKIIS